MHMYFHVQSCVYICIHVYITTCVHDCTNRGDKNDTQSESKGSSPLEVLVAGSAGCSEAESTHHASCVQSCTAHQGTWGESEKYDMTVYMYIMYYTCSSYPMRISRMNSIV